MVFLTTKCAVRISRRESSMKAALIFCLVLAPAPLLAQQLKLVPGSIEDGIPVTGAKVCLNGPLYTCYSMSSLTRGDVTYVFGLDPHARAISTPGPGPWLLFDATFSAGGKNILTKYEIIRSEDTYLVGVLHGVELTNLGDFKIWNEPAISPFPLVVSADVVPSKRERQSRPHFYTVEVRRYDPVEREYFRVLSYRTPRKYSRGHSSSTRVITPEHARILRRLQTLKLNP
jgi:hypothetical protein